MTYFGLSEGVSSPTVQESNLARGGKVFRSSIASLILCCAAGAAQALSLTFNLGTGQISKSSGAISSIDVTSYLTDYEVTSGSIYARVGDDADQGEVSTGSYGSYRDTGRDGRNLGICGSFFTCYDYYDIFQRYRWQSTTFARETALLGVDGATVRSQSSAYRRTPGSGSLGYFARQDSSDGCDRNGTNLLRCRYSITRYYTNSYTLTPRIMIYTLNSANLATLNSSGILSFGVTAGRGDFTLQQGYATVELSARAAAVPLPASGWMFVAGLLGMGVLRRLRKT